MDENKTQSVKDSKNLTENTTSTEKLKSEIEKERKHLNFFDWLLYTFSYKRVALTYTFIVLFFGGVVISLLIGALTGLQTNTNIAEYKNIWTRTNHLLYVLNYYLSLDFLFDNKYTYFLTTSYIFSYLKQYKDLFINVYFLVAVSFFISTLIHYFILVFIFIIIPSLFSVRYRTTFPKHIIKYYENFKRIDELLESSNISARKAKSLYDKKNKLWKQFTKELPKKAGNPVKYVYFTKDIYVYFFEKFDSIKANLIASYYNKRYLLHLNEILSIKNDKDLYNHLFENFYNSTTAKNIIHNLNYNLPDGINIYDLKNGSFFRKSKKYKTSTGIKDLRKTNILKILITLKIAKNLPLERIYTYLFLRHGILITDREKVVIKNARKYFEKKYLERIPPKFIDTQYLILFPDFKNRKYYNQAVTLYSQFLLEKLNYESKLNSLFNEYFSKENENNLKIAIEAYKEFKNLFINTFKQIIILFFKARGVYNEISKQIDIEKFIEDVIYDMYFKEFEEISKSEEGEFKNVTEGGFDVFITEINSFSIEDFYMILNRVKDLIEEGLIKLGAKNPFDGIKIEPFYEKYYRVIDFKQFLKSYDG